jgi:hypothetical protein
MSQKDQVMSIPGVPRVIGPAQHAVLDYAVAGTFLSMAARYRDRNRAASTLALLNGAMVLGMSLFTDYPGGVWRRISFRTHGMLDGIQAALAGFGPVLFGFANRSEARFFYSQALSEVGVIASTDWNATTPDHGHSNVRLNRY